MCPNGDWDSVEEAGAIRGFTEGAAAGVVAGAKAGKGKSEEEGSIAGSLAGWLAGADAGFKAGFDIGVYLAKSRSEEEGSDGVGWWRLIKYIYPKLYGVNYIYNYNVSIILN